MRIEKQLKIGAHQVTIKELNVAEVREWMEEAKSGAKEATADVLGMVLLPEVAFADLARMCNVTVSEMEEWLPSELQELSDRCQEINKVFFGMLARLDVKPRAAAG